MHYRPAQGDWEEAEPSTLGFDPERIAQAVAFAEGSETAWPYDLSAGLAVDRASGVEPPPWNEVLGPTRDRGAPNGLIVRHGRIAARWGDSTRADMTFSVAKSYLALLAGIAVRDGLIRSLDERVGDSALDDGYRSAQNRDVTWRHLLTQTSEWEGTLFDKPDLIDRNRAVGPGADNSAKGTHRELQAPGTYWEYNDVRVNRLSLSLLQLFRRPLPEVLRDEIMHPIGASDTWEWLAYRDAVVEIDGKAMPSVPGGGHWGGGIFIGSEDHARVGLLVAADGVWGARPILPPGWVEEMTRPIALNPEYGFLWWVNPERRHYASAPQTSVFAMGAGSNIIWVDRALDLVVVARSIDASSVNGLCERVTGALARGD